MVKKPFKTVLVSCTGGNWMTTIRTRDIRSLHSWPITSTCMFYTRSFNSGFVMNHIEKYLLQLSTWRPDWALVTPWRIKRENKGSEAAGPFPCWLTRPEHTPLTPPPPFTAVAQTSAVNEGSTTSSCRRSHRTAGRASLLLPHSPTVSHPRKHLHVSM